MRRSTPTPPSWYGGEINCLLPPSPLPRIRRGGTGEVAGMMEKNDTAEAAESWGQGPTCPKTDRPVLIIKAPPRTGGAGTRDGISPPLPFWRPVDRCQCVRYPSRRTCVGLTTRPSMSSVYSKGFGSTAKVKGKHFPNARRSFWPTWLSSPVDLRPWLKSRSVLIYRLGSEVAGAWRSRVQGCCSSLGHPRMAE